MGAVWTERPPANRAGHVQGYLREQIMCLQMSLSLLQNGDLSAAGDEGILENQRELF